MRAYLLFTSASCFADILSTRGRDQTLLLQGLGQQQGLGQLFRRMAKLAWGEPSLGSHHHTSVPLGHGCIVPCQQNRAQVWT